MVTFVRFLTESSVLLFLFTISTLVTALDLPPYLKACKRNDPKLNECATKHAQEGLQGFINGDRKYKVPNLNPLIIPEMEITQGTEQVGLKISMRDLKFYNLKDTKVESIEIDMENKSYTWGLLIPKLEVIANYNVTGKVLLLPIFGNGVANITLDQAKFTYKWKYSLYQKKGDEYVKPHKGVMTYTLKKAYINLDNLFNGDKLLGGQMNRFLNENWQEAVQEIGPSFGEALSRLIHSIMTNICDTVPHRLIFVD